MGFQLKAQLYFCTTLKMKTLILGAYGQVGQELITALSKRIGMKNIICADLKEPPSHLGVQIHEKVDATNEEQVNHVIKHHHVKQIYCLTALLSATGEVNPMLTEHINMKSLFNCLEAARKFSIDRIFWPSSIAAFGQDTPKDTPQETIMNPDTVYGVTKKAGELWCQYYAKRFGVDVRSIRYPGLIGYRSLPGGGTTDYAVDIFHSALKEETYYCYLSARTYLPMIYTDDAIEATLQIMEVPSDRIKIRTSYNIGAMSFCPQDLAAEIQKVRPNFQIDYKIDPVRQKIADSWPHRLFDDEARRDWGFNPRYDITRMTKEILDNLKV